MVPSVDLHTLISVGLGSERKVVSLPGTEEINARSEFELMHKLGLRRNPKLLLYVTFTFLFPLGFLTGVFSSGAVTFSERSGSSLS